MLCFLLITPLLLILLLSISPIYADNDAESHVDATILLEDSTLTKTKNDILDIDTQDGRSSVVVADDGGSSSGSTDTCTVAHQDDDSTTTTTTTTTTTRLQTSCTTMDHNNVPSIIQHEQQQHQQQPQHHDVPLDSTNQRSKHHSFFPDCRLYLATSTLAINSDASSSTSSSSPTSSGYYSRRLGLYTVQPIPRGHPIGAPDILIHLVDYPEALSSFVSHHSFEASQFGAQYEAKKVASILPGIPSLSQSTIMAESNVVPFYGRDMDEADVPRTVEPGAGALTHYHNLTFVATQYLDAGSEIFVGIPHGQDEKWSQSRMEWIRQRDEILIMLSAMEDGGGGGGGGGGLGVLPRGRRDVEWIQEHGMCVDHLRVQKSRRRGVGRGAFAKRYIPKGSIVSVSPLVPIDRKAAVSVKVKNGKGREKESSKPQLLVNYCLGHVNSSVLFYPTAPVVNLINHDRHGANVELQWSTSSEDIVHGLNVSSISLEDVVSRFRNSDDLVMKFVATRDIRPNEEIYMDYGLAWSRAWEKHVQEWNPVPGAVSYAPSYVMDDVAALLRTEKEQVDHPYPSNVMTACFYRYSTHQRNDGIASSNQASAGETTTVQWKMDRRTFDYRNLRPCQVIKREDIDGKIYYTAIMKNWNGMKKDELIPKHEIHVVSSIPRHAIRFVDKLYTTDMHLSNAFRHEIQIPDDIFPCAWKDLDDHKVCEETQY
jgi:hypothetical protein